MAADQRHGLELNYRAVPYRMCGMQATFKEGVNTPRLYSGVPRGEESMSREGDAYIMYWVRRYQEMSFSQAFLNIPISLGISLLNQHCCGDNDRTH